MAISQDTSAPYAPATALLDLIDRHRQRGLPAPVDKDVLSRAGVSESLIPRTLSALQVLDLIDADGRHTETFEGLRLAPETEFKARMVEWLNASYADILQFVDPKTDDDVAIRDAFRPFNPTGQQDRMVTLFTGLYTAAGERENTQPAEKSRSVRRRRVKPKPAGEKPDKMEVVKKFQTYERSDDKRGETDQHPFIQGLLQSLPSVGTKWNHTDRVKWLTLAANAFDMIYEGECNVVVKNVSPGGEAGASKVTGEADDFADIV